MTHKPNTYPQPCRNRHSGHGDPEVTEVRRKGTCLVLRHKDQDGTTVEVPEVYCPECCPVCGGKG